MTEYKKNLDPKETICRDLWSYPVIELGRPKVRTCCKRYGDVVTQEQLDALGVDVFLNLPKTRQERTEMINGTQVEGCKACWELENTNQTSFRLGADDWQYHFNNESGNDKFRPFGDLIKDPEVFMRSTKPNKLDLVMGTYCDQKCVYCCSDFSTQWESEDFKYGILWNDPRTPRMPEDLTPINSKTIELWYETFLLWFNSVYEHLERIALMGGEPTFSPFFVPLSEVIIKKLNEKHHPNCTLSIVTNMNWKKDVLDRIIKMRKELPPDVKIVIEVSMESVGEKAEYIRKGVNWDRFIQNLKSVAEQPNLEVVLVPTINSLCITSFIDYLKNIKEIETQNNVSFKIIANRVIFPKWLSVNALDSTFKPYVEECITWLKTNYGDDLKKKDLIQLLENINETLDQPVDPELVGYSIVWLQELDKRRNTNFLKTFPEYTSFIERHSQYIKPLYTNQHMRKWSY